MAEAAVRVRLRHTEARIVRPVVAIPAVMVDVRYGIHPPAVEAFRLRLPASPRRRGRWRMALVGAWPRVLRGGALGGSALLAVPLRGQRERS